MGEVRTGTGVGEARHPARVVIPVGFAIALALLGDLALFASLPANVGVVGLSIANLGLIFSIHRLIRIPGNTLVGAWINASRRRPFFLAGMALAVASTLGYGVVRGLTLLIFARLVWGVAWMLLYTSSIAMLIDVTGARNRGRWMGVYNTWYLVGIAGGSLLGGVLVDGLGFRQAMILCAGLTGCGFAGALIALPETGRARRAPGSGATSWAGVWRAFCRVLLSTPGLRRVLALYLVNQFASEGGALSVLSVLLAVRLGDRGAAALGFAGIPSLSGALLALRFVLSAALSPVAGLLSDRMARGRARVLASGLLISALSLLLIGYGRGLGLIVLGVVLNALGGAGVLVSLAALLGDLAPPDAEGAVTGLYATAGDVGSALGPVLAYALLAYVPVSAVFLLCAGLFAGGLALTWMGRTDESPCVDRSCHVET